MAVNSKLKKNEAPQAVESKSPEVLALEKKVAELEAKVIGGEEAAMSRVCRALNVDPEMIRDEKPKVKERMIRCEVPMMVNINGTKYIGIVEVPESVYQVIAQAVGDRRNRLLRELTADKVILHAIGGGEFRPVVLPIESDPLMSQGDMVR